MSIRQPGVKWEQWHLNRKSNKERKKEPVLLMRRKVGAVKLKDVERCSTGLSFMKVVQEYDGYKHQQTAGNRVQEKFHRSVDTVWPAPDSNQEIHRNQHHFPEQVKQ